jgi:hypothetical protein
MDPTMLWFCNNEYMSKQVHEASLEMRDDAESVDFEAGDLSGFPGNNEGESFVTSRVEKIRVYATSC